MSNKNDIGSLCRIKVNKMLSSLNSNKNIFIPKYTLLSKREEKYSYLNKSKGNSAKINHNNLNKNISHKSKLNKSQIATTEENYNTQPIDFIINHGVLVYQRNFKGEEIVNLGINNEYLRKNKFNMVKNDNTIYQTDSNFKISNDNISFHKKNYSTQKKMKLNGSKKTLKSMSEIPISKNKYSSSRQKKILNTNLNTTQNSISSVNSISVKNFFTSTMNKNINKTKTNPSLNLKNTKKVNNYVRKKKNNHNISNKFLLFKKKKNYTLIGKKNLLNNESEIKDKNDKIISKINDNKYYTAYIIKKNDLIKDKKLYDNNSYNPKINYNININKEFEKKIKILIIKIKSCFYKKYFNIFIDNIFKHNNHIIEKEDINKNYNDDINEKGQNTEKRINKISITEKCRQNKNIKNSNNNKEHKKSNSIIVNKKISSNSTNTNDIQNNNTNNNNNIHNNTYLSLLISKNLKFFSKDKNNNNSDKRESELFRDTKNLQKKYEQICRRKKKNMTMTFSSKFKDTTSVIDSNNYLSDMNKTNSFSNLFDNNSVNSLQVKQNNKKFNQVFYKDSSATNSNKKDKETEKDKNMTDNKKDKNIYKIKLIKNNMNHKKIISYRIEKKLPHIIDNNNNVKDKDNLQYSNFSEINNIKNYNNTDNNEKKLTKKFSFNSNNNKKINEYKTEENNNKYNKKVFIHKKKNYLLEDKNNFKIKDIYMNREKNIDTSKINKKNKHMALLIKNICTKDKRISIRITYISNILNTNKNNRKYNNDLLNIENIINYNYNPNVKKNKTVIKRKNDLEKKLSLIKEEDEKSKYLNSTKSSKILEDELNSTKKKNNNIRLIKELSYNPNFSKILNILDKKYPKYSIIIDKKEFIYKLKIICLVSHIKNIIMNKIRNTYMGKCLKKKSLEQNKIMLTRIKKQKMKENIQQISNIYIKDKIFLNNIIINDNFLSSRSHEYKKGIKNSESTQLKHNIYYNEDEKNIDDISNQPKTDNYRYNYIEEKLLK